VLKKLHHRSDWQAWCRMLGHLGALLVSGVAFWYSARNGWWLIAAVVLLWHGMVFSFLGYAGACHELSHGTVFRSRRWNQFWLSCCRSSFGPISRGLFVLIVCITVTHCRRGWTVKFPQLAA